jgi:nucleoid-associated protein YgaU
MIVQGSRYADLVASAYTVTTGDGRQERVLPIRFLPPTPATFRHAIGPGDRLDLLASRYYGNPEKFWLIADANDALDPEDLLEPGLAVLIPPDRDS